jgi:hypothetical protein
MGGGGGLAIGFGGGKFSPGRGGEDGGGATWRSRLASALSLPRDSSPTSQQQQQQQQGQLQGQLQGQQRQLQGQQQGQQQEPQHHLPLRHNHFDAGGGVRQLTSPHGPPQSPGGCGPSAPRQPCAPSGGDAGALTGGYVALGSDGEAD